MDKYLADVRRRRLQRPSACIWVESDSEGSCVFHLQTQSFEMGESHKRRHSLSNRGSTHKMSYPQRAHSEVGETSRSVDGDDMSEDESHPRLDAEASSVAEQPQSDATTPTNDRPTRPLPNARARKLVPNPSMVPVQATVPRTPAQKSSKRHLIVVLEQACLEAYRVSSGSASRGGKDGKDVKYALLNCDDHQGILAKTGRDIADARPDITHQVCPVLFHKSLSYILQPFPSSVS